ncbi:hypothetical protein P4S68_08175 [Pseudoalteromonas sp. Hal099]
MIKQNRRKNTAKSGILSGTVNASNVELPSVITCVAAVIEPWYVTFWAILTSPVATMYAAIFASAAMATSPST